MIVTTLNTIYYLVVGIGVAGFWSLFIGTGSMDFARLGVLDSVFHLTSEALLAVASVTTAALLIRSRRNAAVRRSAHALYFTASGLLLSSVASAAFYYLLDPVEGDTAMAILFGALAVAGGLLLAFSLSRYRDLGADAKVSEITSGALIYALLNVCGSLIGEPGWNPGQVAVLLIGMVLLGWLASRDLRRSILGHSDEAN
jgi:hypothetical protein